jgi:hypothetical protein
MRLIAVFGFAALVSACATTQPASNDGLSDLDKKYIGQKFGVDDLVAPEVCPMPGSAQGRCRKPKAWSSLIIDGVKRTRDESMGFYHAQFEDGSEGYIVWHQMLYLKTEEAAAECKRRGSPHVGMTANQVIATCWGEPDSINRRETATGTSEQYVYSGNRLRLVYLRDGVVTSIEFR